MSLSKFLHDQEHINKAAELDFLAGRKYFGELALDYLSKHNEYYSLIESNLKHFELPSEKDAVENTVKNIGYHYHEKFLAFVKEPEFYPDFFKAMERPKSKINELLDNQDEFQPTLILTTHFGAMPLNVGLFNSCGLDISAMVRFPSEEFKKFHESRAKAIIKAVGSGRLKIYDATQAPMAKIGAALARGVTLFTVMDEHTPLNHNVQFLGKTISGGSGVDQIIDFIGKEKIKVYLSLLMREGENYKLNLHKIDLFSLNYLQDAYSIFQDYVKENYEQWFFLQEVHENIPG